MKRNSNPRFHDRKFSKATDYLSKLELFLIFISLDVICLSESRQLTQPYEYAVQIYDMLCGE